MDVGFGNCSGYGLHHCVVVVEPLLALSVVAHEVSQQSEVATFDARKMAELGILSVPMVHLLFCEVAGAGFHQLHVG